MTVTHNNSPSAPLNILVHIPKTAGTTANAVLRQHGTGVKHIERFLSKPARLNRALMRSDWISGHVPFETLRDRITPLTQRPLRWFTILRDPVAQLASHYNWWFEVYARGPHSFYRYGRYFRDLSRQIRSADNSDPQAVIAILREHEPLFLNMQAKFILSPRPNWTSAEITTRLTEFDSVALGSALSPMLTKMTGTVIPAPPRRNVARQGFDRAVFQTPHMAEFLQQAHGRDMALWRAANAAPVQTDK